MVVGRRARLIGDAHAHLELRRFADSESGRVHESGRFDRIFEIVRRNICWPTLHGSGRFRNAGARKQFIAIGTPLFSDAVVE